MILKVINKLGVFSILASESFFKLKNWSVNFRGSMLLEYSTDNLESFLSDGHLERVHVTSTLSTLGKSTLLVARLKDFS